MCNVPQRCVNLHLVVEIGLGIGIRKGCRDGRLSRLADPSQCEADNALVILNQPRRGHEAVVRGTVAGRERLQALVGDGAQGQRPGAIGAVNLCLDRPAFFRGNTSSELGRQVVAVRIEVALEGHVRWPRLHGIKPCLQVGPAALSPNHFALIVRNGRHNTLEKGRKHNIHKGKLPKKVRTPARDPQLVVDGVHGRLEPPLLRSTTQVVQPVAEKLPLKLQQCAGPLPLAGALCRQKRAVVRIHLLQQRLNDGALRNYLPINLKDWEQPGWNLLHEGPGLGTVAPHVNLLDDVRNPLLFELQHNLVTVGTPSGVISIQLDPRLLRGPKHATQRHGIWWPIFQVLIAGERHAQLMRHRGGHAMERLPARRGADVQGGRRQGRACPAALRVPVAHPGQEIHEGSGLGRCAGSSMDPRGQYDPARSR
mmetsp:Transcript_7916/g.21531  ORF Transcript_7916/g.21531 Transcript_7916/m.21531 type:complete len:424 (-) Transcript_7916:75-1346(-)